jgi:hypothetical protein
MLPANERFGGNDASARFIDERLVVQHELAALQGAIQVALELEIIELAGGSRHASRI